MSGEGHEITAGIINIGDELLIGQTLNTNASWLGEQLSLQGIRPVEVRTIGDDREQILTTLSGATADVVLITGGLGPTKDDITKHTLCTFFGTRLTRRPEVEARIETLFARMGRPLLEMNRTQADLPEACAVIPNLNGTASGMWFERPREDRDTPRVFISLPGVPYELKGMMETEVLPRLRTTFSPPVIVHRTLLTTGAGESQVATRIAAWEEGLDGTGIKLAYLPSPGLVKLRLSAYANRDARVARDRVDRKAEELRALIPDLVFGEGTTRLEEVVGGLLRDAGQTLSLAESCTGGYLSHLITSVPGSSAYYIGGVVSYANAVKMEELGIPAGMLELNGAVSRPVVEQMASGVRQGLRTDWSIALSGIAGPDGGTPEKPVGTVWIAVAGPDGVRSTMVLFPGSRDLVIKRSAIAALNMLRKRLPRSEP
ncbi:MAG: CinA family nicotinamide mononucleotide deamidase-related protein [Flavobacteriales bacterium]|nr:CinA family nicotinamide mononucleotide deamidase-related protein [Flavobacteriales bacterium]MBK7941346.1 CinA family nicotinamide mononucleotide deamidase-related protein [Flavobacteriales bacterium]MBK8949226.1 CinA family nicotinamide mononucleotide deamidase-related protein [Flavobacteriales bacterium]MBK9701369.1 CinA family nicotinamide mononucleotide deamidase-related protein [Flavobacteriales bacterium]